MSNMLALAQMDQRLLEGILEHIFPTLSILLSLNFQIFYHLDFSKTLCLILKFPLVFILNLIFKQQFENLKQHFFHLLQLLYLANNLESSNISCKVVYLYPRANNLYHNIQSQTVSEVFSSTTASLLGQDLFLLLLHILRVKFLNLHTHSPPLL